MTGTEPLDLDAIEADSSEYVEMRDRLKKHDEWRTGLAEITAEHVPALIAEVRRLREEKTAHEETAHSGPMKWICPECGQPTKTASEHEQRHLDEGACA